MNPHLHLLQPYPFEKLRQLFSGIRPPSDLKEIKLSIGEPRHETPAFIRRALCDNLDGMAVYPTTAGREALRQAIAAWIGRRYGIPAPDPASQILPCNGSREALFAFAQAVVDAGKPGALVACPNPFYQIYEGAAYLAGAAPAFLNARSERDFALDWNQLSTHTWDRVQLIYVCSPANPTGQVMKLEDWRTLFELSDRHGFVIAADECYSEIYGDEARPPLGALQAARQLGRDDYRNLVVFTSLSKRSNVPGMRSGFVAGEARLIGQFLAYRTYQGGAMNPAVQAASIAAWNDEDHVRANRRLYADKFARVAPLLTPHLETRVPEAGFYFWARTPVADSEFARELMRQYNVVVLPGSFLARHADGVNPGTGFVRIALVAGVDECLEAADRISRFCQTL